MKRTIFLTVTLMLLLNAFAQKRWTGNANNGLWDDDGNWSDNQKPIATDAVVLDNNNVGESYIVTLPSTAVSIVSINISPTSGNEITLVLPSTNTLANAFSVTGGIILNEGGIFKNSSGATGGNNIVIGDSLKINNGGSYIHNTRCTNASIIKVLSRAAGTEKGIFEFDVPGGSYVISLTGRTFGTLILSAKTAGIRTYTTTGSSTARIRGNLQIMDGVNFGIGMAANIVVENDLIQHGIINLDNVKKSNTDTLKIARNIFQYPGSEISHSGDGKPCIELNGKTPQTIDMQGAINTDISFVVNNSNGVILNHSLSLPYKLNLLNGYITTSGNNLLILQPACSVVLTDTARNYINGPLQKEGLTNSDFYFPVGKSSGSGVLLKNATGDFTVEYFNENPLNIGSGKSPDIDKLAINEYWKINTNVNASAQVAVKRSAAGFDSDPGNKIIISKYTQGLWSNYANDIDESDLFPGYTISKALQFENADNIFAMAALKSGKPLPLKFIAFNFQKQPGNLLLKWTVTNDEAIEWFEVERSLNGKDFIPCGKVAFLPHIVNYTFGLPDPRSKEYFRIKAIDNMGKYVVSRIISFDEMNLENNFLVYASANFVHVKSNMLKTANLRMKIYAMNGSLIKTENFLLQKGINAFSSSIQNIAAGMYIIQLEGNSFGTYTARFVKQ